MKRLTDKLSPLSWGLMVFAIYASFLVVLKPTWPQLALLLGVDLVALFVLIAWERRFLSRIIPEARFFLSDHALEQVAGYTTTEKARTLESFMRLPSKMARYCLVSSFVKTAPGFLVICLWDHPLPPLERFAVTLSVAFTAFAYFYAAVFLETHRFVSRAIIELHGRYGWADGFRAMRLDRADVLRSVGDIKRHENYAFAAIWIFALAVQWVLVSHGGGKSGFALALDTAVISLSALALISRLWYIGRDYLLKGIELVFHAIEDYEPNAPQVTLALHTYPVLAGLEGAFNALTDRLRTYEEEIASWTFLKTEESRYIALGELSALIVHDISAPLQVIRFCVDQLDERPELLRENPKYLSQIKESHQRAFDLVSSLRMYLKDPKPTRGVTAKFDDAYGHVVRLLETQFWEAGFTRVSFETRPDLMCLELRITQADLIHVLFNLLSNGVENLLERGIAGPRVALTLEYADDESATIAIRDNGTGLSSARFEELTAFGARMARRASSREGLGLRLVRRLVETHGGSLWVGETPAGEQGTCLFLTLPLSGKPKPQTVAGRPFPIVVDVTRSGVRAAPPPNGLEAPST